MLSSIITKMVLDRTCPVCEGLQRYRTTDSAKTEIVVCKACNGTGYMSTEEEPSLLLVPTLAIVPPGAAVSMKAQNIHVTDNASLDIEPVRIYTYNVNAFSLPFLRYANKNPKEIHMYFDGN